MTRHQRLLLLILLAAMSACEEREYAKAYKIEHMSQTIGGPAAMARPGDFLLENDRLRAVIHGRHNMRSTSPVGNGSLIDLDIQRPTEGYRVGGGKDAFYELGPMVNLKISSAAKMDHGKCEDVRKRMHSSPCPSAECVRVTSLGRGENIIGLLGLLDMLVKRSYDGDKLRILTDWDVCPGEAVVRVTTTVLEDDTQKDKAKGKTAKVAQMKDLPDGTNLMDKLLGSGVMSGDLTFFSGKMNVFIPGNGFDHDGYIRSVFSKPKGNTFASPLSASFVAGVGDGVSYAYFNKAGKARIPVFTEAFTAALSSFHDCDKNNTKCLLGTELRYKRYVSVGQGDIASALDGFYEMRGIPTAKVEGNVVGRRSRKGLSGVNVFAFRVPAAWSGTDDYSLSWRLAKEGLAKLMKQNRAETGNKVDPFGNPGIVTQFESDVGLDQVADGSITGRLPYHKDWCRLPACRYVLATMGSGREPSTPLLVRARSGETIKPVVVAGDSGRLEYIVRDNAGQSLPSKITIGQCFPECATDRDCAGGKVCDLTSPLVSDKRGLCIPKKGYTASGTCRPDQRWGTDPVTGKKTCICNETGLLPVTMGGHRYADGTVEVIRTHTGHGQRLLEPGIYQVVVSRGFEYDVKRQFITVTPGGVSRLTTSLTRVVDTSGWISADFHVHGPNSPDASAMFEPRVTSFVTEGVELLSSSDHDQLTDYRPTIYKMGMRPYLKSQIGLETSPVDYGHFLGFPLKFNENAELNGAFHWKVQRTDKDDPAPTAIAGQDWRNLWPDEIFAKTRALGSLGPEKTVTVVAHFYDYFNYFYMEPWGKMDVGKTTLWTFLTKFSPVLSHFSADFDAVEGFNGKNLNLIRRPTYQEVGDYTANLNKLLASSSDAKKWSFERLMRHWGRISSSAQREVLRRTAAEQQVGLNFADTKFDCRCTQHSDCATGFCDPATGACGKDTCKDDTACAAALVKAGREKCLPVTAGSTTPAVCQRVHKSCTSVSDCDHTWGSGTKETCVAMAAGAAARRCEIPCKAHTDCKTLDPMRPVCDVSVGICVTTGLNPCRTLRGTVDDWFQLLNRGVVRPFIGNSDTHGTYGVEAGLPRNYVKSSTDLPPDISSEEVAVAVKAGRIFSTYGPFVELSIEGKGMGQKVNIKKDGAVKLKLRIQSPLWFDVDRVEIYRNGLLIKTIKGKHDCKKGSADCIRSPNDAVVNFDGTITDKPTVDSWYVVAVMGLDGKTLAPVYSSSAVAPLGMYELMQRLVPMVPMGSAFSTPLGPSMTIVRPYALTNPIWVDVGGDGLTALLPLPKWATEADRKAFKAPSGSTTSATSTPSSAGAAAGAKGHSHDHSYGLGRMRQDARQMSGISKDKVTVEMLRQALNSLRYMR